MRPFDIDIDPLRISITNEEILSDLLYPSPQGDVGGAEAPPAPAPLS